MCRDLLTKILQKLDHPSKIFNVVLSRDIVPKKLRIAVKIFGKCRIGYFRYIDGRYVFTNEKVPDYAPLYLLYCGRHGVYYIDYPHGFRGYFYECPICRGKFSQALP